MINDGVLYKKIVVLMAVFAIGGCSSFDPYQRSKQLDLPVERLAINAEGYKDKDGVEVKGYDRLAGNLHGAVAAIKDQRNEWMDSLSAQARVRAATQISVIGLSAAALYSGFKTGTSNDSGRKNLALAGALAGGAYAASEYYSNPKQEDAYIEGIRGLTCTLLAAEPLRIIETKFGSMTMQISDLTGKINNMDRELLTAEATLRYADNDKSPAAQVREEALRAFRQARATLLSSEQLAKQFETSGITLLREGDLVFANTAAKIRTHNKSVDAPVAGLNNLAAILGKFREVKINVADEQASKANSGTPPASPPPAAADAPAKPASEVGTKAAAPASAAASAAIKAKTPDTKVKPNPGDTLLSQATVQMLTDQIAVQIQQQIDKLEKDATDKSKKRQEEAEKATERAELAASRAIMSAAELQAACLAKKRPDCLSPTDAVSVNLAALTADLYKARRPLSHQLLVFDAARNAVSKNRACTGAGSPMTVAPSADANVEPGQVYAITINNVTTPPTVNLKGDATFDYGVGPGSNQYTYKVKVAADAKGEIEVFISDRGLATEEIKLTVVKKK